MSLSLKQEIETWVQALEHYDRNEFEPALQCFESIADTSKQLFNCGVIHATIGEHDRAIQCYRQAVGLDQYLAVAYFQEGVSNFLIGEFEEALANFNDTLLYLRGNMFIDYDQLGLKFKLYSCEVLFNRGLCYTYLQQADAGMSDFTYALREKLTPDHDVIDDAIRERAQGYTVFSIPVGVVYRPNEAKVKNLKTKDYLGRAKLVATSSTTNTYTGFAGAEQARLQREMAKAVDDRSPNAISYASSNLIQNISKRDRSAPPSMERNRFPPTPPPETDLNKAQPAAPFSATARNPPTSQLGRLNINVPGPGSSSISPRSGLGATNSPVDFRQQNAAQTPSSASKPRIGTTRSASERPMQRTSDRSADGGGSSGGGKQSKPLYGGAPRRETEPLQIYTQYSSQSHQRTPSTNTPQRTNRGYANEYIQEVEEEDEIIESDSDHASNISYPASRKPQSMRSGRSNNSPLSPVSASTQQSKLPSSYTSNASSSRLSGSSSSAAAAAAAGGRPRKVEMRKLRAKVHATTTSTEIRYIMFNDSHIDFDDFESKLRAKFGLRGRVQIQSRDEDCPEDFVTMSDQDDLDALVTSARAQAKQESSEMGRLEVWVQEVY